MDALLLVLGVGAALLIAYFTYGRWVAGRVFQLRDDTPTPATVLCDNVDYCPTPKTIVFGHHFTSIAGTGPIVGPAIAVMWGWLPAILWVVFGSVFIGAVHDLGSIVVSLRNKGRSVGDIAGDLLGPRVRLIFLSVLVLVLWIVLAIFGLVVASVLRQYPASIFPVLVQVPLAVAIGVVVHRKGKNITIPSLVALAVMYASVIWGDWGPLHTFNATLAMAPMWMWVVGLLAYAYVASVLPVWTLLQPRDYINALQLISALGLLLAGLVVAATLGGAPDDFQPLEHQQGARVITSVGLGQLEYNPADSNSPLPESQTTTGMDSKLDTARRAVPPRRQHTARRAVPPRRPKLEIVAPMVNWRPTGAPPLLPVLFITIACGAVSGFHCLVGSGTSSKQLLRETDARAVGYGSMLTEAFLATLVIAACTAGLGLGVVKYHSYRPPPGVHGRFDDLLFGDRPPQKEYRPTQIPVTQLFLLPENSAGHARSPMVEVFWNLFDGQHSNGAYHPTSFGIRLIENAPYTPSPLLSSYNEEYFPNYSFEFANAPGNEWISLEDGFVRAVSPPTFSGGVKTVDDVTYAGASIELRGPVAWNTQYESWASAQGLTSTVGAFVEGAANLIKALGVSGAVAMALMGVMVASFAGTTMDTACRLQRYVIQELARTFLPKPDAPDTPDEAVDWSAAVRLASPMNPFKWLATMHGATLFAVVTAAMMAALPAPGQSWSLANFGNGGLILWPLFGATNQLLGGLAFLVVGAWLIATKRPWWFMALPAVFMLIVPLWALIWQTFIGNDTTPSWIAAQRWMLSGVGVVTIALEVWLVVEVALRAKSACAERRAAAQSS